MKFKNTLSIMLSLIIVFASAIGYASPAQAKSSRAAEVIEVVGDVQVTKSGGSKAYRAYVGMTLNEGDHIETSEGSSLVLRIKDQEDEITIDEHASLYLSELTDDGGSKKSKVKVWSGSLWGKVKTLTGTNDTFEVETPTAVMGVRGTTLLVGVDPATGETKFYIASGQGQVDSKNNGDGKNGTTLMPNQQVSLDEDSDDYEAYKGAADLDDLITNTSNAIIEAIINAKAAIDEENEQYIAKLKVEQAVSGNNQAELDRIQQNLDNLIGNIVKNAITQGKVDETQIKALIDKINQNLDKKLDLNNVKPMELSAQEKAKQAQIKLLEEERKKKQEAEKLKQEQLKQQNEELQKKLKEQLEKQKAEKQKAEEAAKKKAEEELAKKLADAAAKAALENRIAKAKAEEEAQKKAAIEKELAAQPPVTAPATGGSGGDGSGGDDSGSTLPKKATFALTSSYEGYFLRLNMTASLENVGAVYGAELHLIFDENVSGFYDYEGQSDFPPNERTYFDENYANLNGTIFDSAKSTYNYRIKDITVGSANKKEAIYSVVYVPPAAAKTVGTKEELITIPLKWVKFGESNLIQMKIEKLIVVDQYGNKINVTIDNPMLEIENTHEFESYPG